MSNSSKIKIAIIDSGFTPHNKIHSLPKEMITLTLSEDGELIVHDGAPDILGHGTAVYSIISSKLNEIADICMIKVFSDSMYVDEMLLISAMQFCIENISPDIIHMSNGITCCANLEMLKKICYNAEQQGIYIIAAFDNFGAVTYPAALENVIGVDVSNDIKTGYIYSERKDVNIIVPNISRRVPWLNNSYVTCNGTSFNACFITIMIAYRLFNACSKKSELMKYLRENASRIIKTQSIKNIVQNINIKRAIILPYNKEMQTIARYMNMLNFLVVGIYDIKYNGMVGKSISEMETDQSSSKSKNLVIKSLDSINWNEDFDTVIIGHLSDIEKVTHRNYIHDIVGRCLQHSKSIYSFFDLKISLKQKALFNMKGLSVYVPSVSKENVPDLYNGKIRKIGTPILGVFGTSSKQGKFSLQLELRHFFQSKGYIVGQLGTEPSSMLFEFDEVFPMGFESTVETVGEDNIAIINEMMGRIEDKNPDLIIVGSQSQVIPQYRGNLSLYVLRQHEFILATEPDAILLCVNIFDEDQYIENTIKYIEALIDSEVIGLVLFPMQREFKNGIMTNRLIPASKKELIETKSRLFSMHRRPVFIAGDEIDKIGDLCIHYFAE